MNVTKHVNVICSQIANQIRNIVCKQQNINLKFDYVDFALAYFKDKIQLNVGYR